jgi:hypothetical protein
VASSFGFIGPVRKAYVRDGVICEVAKDPVVTFRKAKRKDEIATPAETDGGMRKVWCLWARLRRKPGCSAPRGGGAEKTGVSCPWLVRSTAMVNQFHVHCADREFGPFFLKFCTYIPYNAKLCLNAHEYVKTPGVHRRSVTDDLQRGPAAPAIATPFHRPDRKPGYR